MREHVLKKFKSTHLTEIGYNILRAQKKEQKKTMMQIIEDDLIQKYESKRNIVKKQTKAGTNICSTKD